MIRPASFNDLGGVIQLLEHFAKETNLEYDKWTREDWNNAKNRLLDLIKTQYLIVADTGDRLVGMIGAQIEPDPWIVRRRRLRELFWWVEPDFRNSRLSVKLFAQWQADVEKYLNSGLVTEASLSLQPGISNIDLNRRGWRCVEEHWIKG